MHFSGSEAWYNTLSSLSIYTIYWCIYVVNASKLFLLNDFSYLSVWMLQHRAYKKRKKNEKKKFLIRLFAYKDKKPGDYKIVPYVWSKKKRWNKWFGYFGNSGSSNQKWWCSLPSLTCVYVKTSEMVSLWRRSRKMVTETRLFVHLSRNRNRMRCLRWWWWWSMTLHLFILIFNNLLYTQSQRTTNSQ